MTDATTTYIAEFRIPYLPALSEDVQKQTWEDIALGISAHKGAVKRITSTINRNMLSVIVAFLADGPDHANEIIDTTLSRVNRTVQPLAQGSVLVVHGPAY